MSAPVDFTAYRHPVLAVACPLCRARPGAWCVRPSEHKAANFHAERKILADRIWIQQGALEIINITAGTARFVGVGRGIWKYGKPTGVTK
jgi:hypothetical protein